MDEISDGGSIMAAHRIFIFAFKACKREILNPGAVDTNETSMVVQPILFRNIAHPTGMREKIVKY